MKHILTLLLLAFALNAPAQTLPRLYSNKKVWGKLIPIQDKRVRVNRTDSMTANYVTISLVYDNMATDTTAEATFRVEFVADNNNRKLSLRIQHVVMDWHYYLNSWNANDNESTVSWVIQQIGVTLKSN